jgi:hypothetical protein
MIVAGASTAAAASAAVWLGVASQNVGPAGGGQRPPSPAASAPGGSEDAVIVCVGTDRILRASLPEGGCPPNHRQLSLLPEAVATCRLCPPFDEARTPETGEDQALNDVERRLRALENTPYFEVVNDSDQPVFRVGPGGVQMFNKNGVAVAAFGSSESGGYFSASSGTAELETSLGAAGKMAGLKIVEDGLVRLDLTAMEGAGAALRVPSGTGVVAALGASVSGAGSLFLGTRGGEVKASFTIIDGRGQVTTSHAPKGGAALLESRHGGGMFEISDTQGQAAVWMGHVEHRYGIVMAGPVLGLPLVPKTGLPGSYFMGCGSQARPACMPVAP